MVLPHTETKFKNISRTPTTQIETVDESGVYLEKDVTTEL